LWVPRRRYLRGQNVRPCSTSNTWRKIPRTEKRATEKAPKMEDERGQYDGKKKKKKKKEMKVREKKVKTS